MSTGFEIGNLVVDENGNRGVVRYVGPVATSKKKETVYVGVEWDDVARGKHDGSVTTKANEKIQHFKCEKQGNCASFVKPQFLRAGTSFNEALIERYEPEKLDQGSQPTGSSLEGPRRLNGEAVEIHAVGMDAIRNKQRITKLKEVSLSSCAVAAAGPAGWIRENCPSIKELDLSDNLLDSWTMVGAVVSQLDELEHLSLARNQLENLPVLESLPESMKLRHECLKVLVLNKTGTSFAQIQRLDTEGVFPCLEELVLGDNDLTSLNPLTDVKTAQAKAGTYAAWATEQIQQVDHKGFTPESFAKGFRHLRRVDVSRNKISSWSELWRLSRLPSLTLVNASDNPVGEVFYDKPVSVEEVETQEENVAENEVWQKKRLEAAKEFEKTLEPKSPESNDCATATDTDGANVLRKEVDDGIDIVMSNGLVVPVSETLEPAKYTDARLFKGDGTGGGAAPFTALKTLLLCRTRINDWSSIDALNSFPSLFELRLQGSPVVTTAASTGAARQTIVARVKQLNRLNGSEVSERERADAERLYLKRVALTMASDGKSLDAVIVENPRYKELVEIHGDPMEAAKRAKEAQEAGGSLASNSAKITIKSYDPRTCTIPPVTKRLPLTMTIRELKSLCLRLFKVDVSLQKLFYAQKDGHPTYMDEDIMTLADYAVKPGGEIVMEARDPEYEKEKEEKKARKLAEKMKQQEERVNLESDMKRAEVENAKKSVIG